MPALRSALELGAHFIEIDVHLAADGVPMVVYDRQLAEITAFIVIGQTCVHRFGRDH